MALHFGHFQAVQQQYSIMMTSICYGSMVSVCITHNRWQFITYTSCTIHVYLYTEHYLSTSCSFSLCYAQMYVFKKYSLFIKLLTTEKYIFKVVVVSFFFHFQWHLQSFHFYRAVIKSERSCGKVKDLNLKQMGNPVHVHYITI